MARIVIASTENAINDCYPVMCQLRPHITQAEFLPTVKAQMQNGYHLACVEADGIIVACAGFQYAQNLAWGKFLYVDDLITDDKQRCRGFGKLLMDWLAEQANIQGCAQLHLDSGVQRKDAHRFYAREGMEQTGYHFAVLL